MAQEEDDLRTVEVAARRGARSITAQRQVIVDAVDETLYRWALSRIVGRQLQNTEGWAYRVGANAAKRLGKEHARRQRGTTRVSELPAAVTSGRQGMMDRDALRAHLQHAAQRLTVKQLLVARKLCEPGMSFHEAARQLEMDRSSLRRTFKRALVALAVP